MIVRIDKLLTELPIRLSPRSTKSLSGALVADFPPAWAGMRHRLAVE
jgi:hypothetical protein